MSDKPTFTFAESGKYTVSNASGFAPLFAKPNYNMTFSNADGVIGTLDFNGPEMVFTGKAEESAKVFFDWIAQCFAQRLAELEQDKKRLEWVMPIISGDDTPDANSRTFKIAAALTLGLEGRACIDGAMK